MSSFYHFQLVSCRKEIKFSAFYVKTMTTFFSISNIILMSQILIDSSLKSSKTPGPKNIRASFMVDFNVSKLLRFLKYRWYIIEKKDYSVVRILMKTKIFQIFQSMEEHNSVIEIFESVFFLQIRKNTL